VALTFELWDLSYPLLPTPDSLLKRIDSFPTGIDSFRVRFESFTTRFELILESFQNKILVNSEAKNGRCNPKMTWLVSVNFILLKIAETNTLYIEVSEAHEGSGNSPPPTPYSLLLTGFDYWVLIFLPGPDPGGQPQAAMSLNTTFYRYRIKKVRQGTMGSWSLSLHLTVSDRCFIMG
jgi:hypothetical protein